MKEIMLGNEAIARGAYEASCHVISSYPGTPSTEITEYAASYNTINCEWAPNEKVAAEVAFGASLAGARAMTCMKHVGVNVAADPIFTAAYTGVNGGFVIVCADDPGMHSSQNEQDSRMYARAANIPMLEPSNSQECKDFIKIAFELSNKYDTPIFVRTTTRISHARSPVEINDKISVEISEYKKNPQKYVMLPGNARSRHIAMEDRFIKIENDISAIGINKIEINDTKLGIITSGASYNYVKDAIPNASVFKIGIVHPLPFNEIVEFAKQVDRIVVIEELEPVIEEQLKTKGIECEGKELTGKQGELSINKIAKIFNKNHSTKEAEKVIIRPPSFCPGCPHRGIFTVFKELELNVMGDIGCYTLGALPPYSAMDACLCMGASIGMAFGAEKAQGKEFSKNTVAVLGDSTFIHSGITSLIDAVYNHGSITVIILDNRTTGMTGHQENPTTGKDIYNNESYKVDIEGICRACGVNRINIVDPFNKDECIKVLKEEINKDEVSVIIVRRPCALLRK